MSIICKTFGCRVASGGGLRRWVLEIGAGTTDLGSTLSMGSDHNRTEDVQIRSGVLRFWPRIVPFVALFAIAVLALELDSWWQVSDQGEAVSEPTAPAEDSQPAPPLEAPKSPAEAVADAYNQLMSLDTVHYRINRESDNGLRFIELIQLNLTSGIEYWRQWGSPADPGKDPANYEAVVVDGQRYNQMWGMGWRHVGNATELAPLGGLGRLPWAGWNRFDNVRRLQDEELDGVPMAHYVAVKMAGAGPGRIQDEIHLWVGKDDELPFKVEWHHESRWEEPKVDPQTLLSNKASNLQRIAQLRDIRARHVFTFTAFNVPVDLPPELPLDSP